jgi:Na+/phosphate symporter
MFDAKDLDVFKSMMMSVMDEQLVRLRQNLPAFPEECLTILEQSMLVTIDEHLRQSENMVLEEIERTRKYLERKTEMLQKSLRELDQYYHITKLENDNTALLLKITDDLSNRLDTLEQGTVVRRAPGLTSAAV